MWSIMSDMLGRPTRLAICSLGALGALSGLSFVVYRIFKNRKLSQNPPAALRLLVTGPDGHGKSTTGNSILGKKLFTETNPDSTHHNRFCISKDALVNGRRTQVVEVPWFFGETLYTDADLKERELTKSMLLTRPGFHGIALVIKKGVVVDELQRFVDEFRNFFGENVMKFAFIVVADVSSQGQLDRFLETASDKLITLTKLFEEVVFIDSNGAKKAKEMQVSAIINIVDRHFCNEKFTILESILQNDEIREEDANVWIKWFDRFYQDGFESELARLESSTKSENGKSTADKYEENGRDSPDGIGTAVNIAARYLACRLRKALKDTIIQAIDDFMEGAIK